MIFIIIINKFLRQYQTRQQLKKLPEHLYEDIKRSSEEVTNEVNKNSLIHILLNTFVQLFKGVWNGYLSTIRYFTFCFRYVSDIRSK